MLVSNVLLLLSVEDGMMDRGHSIFVLLWFVVGMVAGMVLVLVWSLVLLVVCLVVDDGSVFECGWFESLKVLKQATSGKRSIALRK